jgi:hypothetical protein
VCVIYVLDEEALGEELEVLYGDRELLVDWYDAFEKTVRYRWRSVVDISQEMALINMVLIDNYPVWTQAEIGEDYN